MLIGLFLQVFREEGYAVGVFQNVHQDALLAKHVFVAGEIRDAADDQAMELTPVDERGADVTGAERGEHRRLAEIQAADSRARRTFLRD